MDQKEMRIRNIIIVIIFAVILNSMSAVLAVEKKEEAFNYNKLIHDEFKLKVGSVIPLTIWQSVETDGILTTDGKYLFFSSDKDRGNFDIYVRAMSDITTVRITEHSSRDTDPAISPDGKYLAFVSQREDPEGDIYILKLDIEDLVKKTRESVSGVGAIDSAARNLTMYKDPQLKSIKIIKDASPVWSPDGSRIAFSSARDGIENIWLMDRNGENLTQLTKKGGMYPRFSNDGAKLIFISYRDKGSNGEVYILNIATHKEERVTNTPDIELHPGFFGNDNEIVYTLIDRDTNKDRKIDLNDNSVLQYKNLTTGIEYQLTLYSESSFHPVWFPFYEGIIVYSNLANENINVNFIPDYGIIPKRRSAGLQYDLSEQYLIEYDDISRYLLSLERVFYYFGNSTDLESRIYVSRALGEAARIYLQQGDKEDSVRVQEMLSSISKNESDYSNIISRYIDNLLQGKPGDQIFIKALSDPAIKERNKALLPFLFEDLGDEYLHLKKQDDAVKTYANIIRDYPDFKRIIYVHYKLASLTNKTLREGISPSYIKVLSSGYLFPRVDAIKDILKIFKTERDPDRRIKIAREMFEKYKNTKYAPELFLYIIGSTYFNIGNPANAKKTLIEALNFPRKSTYMYYKINILLGKIAENEKNYIEMEKYLFEGADNYARRYKEDSHRDVVLKLINYYEEYGERAESAGDYKKAEELYQKYVSTVKYLHARKIFPDIYNEYAPRAHILYIDAYSDSRGNKHSELLKLEYKYDKEDNNLGQARLGLDKAHIYGLAYIFSKLATTGETPSFLAVGAILNTELEEKLINFSKATEQVEWALFMDDTFIDPEILKGWIYQYVDFMRNEDEKAGAKHRDLFNKYFPEYLWEKNITNYEKALEINNENKYPEKEGDLHLNIANSFFLLKNFQRAFTHYKEVLKYKKIFDSNIQEALFYYHLGYCYWQNGEPAKAREEMRKTMRIYDLIYSGNHKKYKFQTYFLYRFFALFDRVEGNYKSAIKWFTSVMDFSKKYKIKIDRARYIQEIAYCYKELGETKTALAYLKMADSLLKNYDLIQKDYSIKLEMFGVVRFGIWDLGPDAFVIGNSRIYDELDTVQKRLLNAALEYEIHYENGELHESIECLQKKLRIIGDREDKLYTETKIKTLNNIGYCYFRLGDFDNAGEFFEQARDLSAEPDVNDLEGIFISTRNNANLYSFMLENHISTKDPVDSIDSLINQISDYRSSFETNRFNEEMKSLKEIAGAQKREISDNEIRDIKDRVAEETRSRYYSLDITAGVLEYQKAGLLVRDLKNGTHAGEEPGTVMEQAFSDYKNKNKIFRLYYDAASRFENAAQKAESLSSKRLLVKLLLNIAGGQAKIGLIDDSYNTYLSALDYASTYYYEDLLWITHLRIADFLIAHGQQVEGDAYKSLALDYYKNSADIVKELPMLYTGEIKRVKYLYKRYTKLLADSGKSAEALKVSENGYGVLRIMQVALESPKFHNDIDNDYYQEYVKQARDIHYSKRDLSVYIESGESDAEKISALKKIISDKVAGYKKFIADTGKTRPFFTTYISLPENNIPKYDNAVLYKFIDSDNGLYAWKIDSGKIQFQELFFGRQESGNPLKTVAEFMNDGNAGKYRFVILNETSVRIFEESVSGNTKIPPFMYIPCIERAAYYMSANNINSEDAFYDGNGLAGLPSPAFFFNRRLEPAFAILDINGRNIDYINQLIESSLYSGIRTMLIYYNYKDAPDEAALIAEASLKSFDTVSPENRALLRIGFKGYTPQQRKDIAGSFKEKQYNKFQQSLAGDDPDSAELYLNKWRDMGLSENERTEYPAGMSMIEFIRGNIISSISYNDRVMLSLSESSPAYLKALSNKIFLLLYKGDFQEADTSVNQGVQNKVFNDTIDHKIYRSVIDMAVRGIIPSVMECNEIIKGKSILPGNKLKLLYAEFLSLFGKTELVNVCLEKWENNYTITEREILKLAFLKGKASGSFILSPRAGEVLSVLDGKNGNLKNKAALTMLSDGQYDSMSVYPVFFAIKDFTKNIRFDMAVSLLSEVDVKEIRGKALWLDTLQLLVLMTRLYKAEERYNDALNTVREMNNLTEEISFSSLLRIYKYKEAAFLSRLKKYNESYTTALSGIALLDKKDDLYVKFQLLLIEEALYLGRFEEAVMMAAEIEPDIQRNEYKYVFYLLKSRIELLKIINKGNITNAEWQKIEKLILSSLQILDASPEVIYQFNRIDLVNEALDLLISYSMSRKKIRGSLLFAEVKKQINLRSKYPGLVSGKDVPEKILTEFKAIAGNQKSMEFIKLFKEYPALYTKALAPILPLEVFQKQINPDSLVVYLTANVNDILCWFISRDSVESLRLKDGYEKVSAILSQYDNISLNTKITRNISRELFNMFRPVYKYFKDRHSLIIVTDNALERIPFEIIGERDMLSETFNVAYLTSILSSFLKHNTENRKVSFIDKESRDPKNWLESDFIYRLETVAVKESGIDYDYPAIATGIAHLNTDILFDSFKGSLYIKGSLYSNVINAGIAYMPVYNINNISFNEFALINSLAGVKRVIINNAGIHDLNNAFFVYNFYKTLNKGSGITVSFRFAKESLQKEKRFSDPVYWSNIRLYINGM